MKTIAVVLNTSWNIYNFRLNLMKNLQKNGFRVVAIAPKDKYSQKLIENGFEWINLPLDNNGTNPLSELYTIKDFYDIYNKLKPDIILQYTIKPNLYGTLVATFLKIPVINNISGLGTVFLKDKLVYKFARILYKIILRFPRKIFFQNKDDYNMFIQKKLVKSSLCDIVPGSGIDSNKFIPKKRVDADSLPVTFLMIARLIKDKGIIEYIDAIKILKRKYPNTRFQLIGSLYPGNPSAISKSKLNEWIDNNYIEYLGFSDNMETIISKVDCITLPSYREGLSRVLLESASMAKPIVTTNVVGCKDVVEHGVNGFLCKVKDANSLAIEMEKIILMTPQERKNMGDKGRKRIIKEFDEKIVIDKYLDAISKILNKKIFPLSEQYSYG